MASLLKLFIFAKDNSITQKVLGRNRIKYLTSLKIKKFRDESAQFIIEGEKIVKDTLALNGNLICELIATELWLNENRSLFLNNVAEVTPANPADLKKISGFETPSPVIALLNIPKHTFTPEDLAGYISLGFDNIQDPGNLGTIIRTADWFGIKNIFCSTGSCDAYNPKVVQASMGAIFNVSVHYTNLIDLLKTINRLSEFPVYGTFMKGESIYSLSKIDRGFLLFGNESRGISDELNGMITKRITIPSRNKADHVESLNVASSVGITLATLCK